MDISEVLKKYREAEEKNIFITDTEGRLLYQSPKTEYDLGMLLDKINKISENFDEQEVLDKNNEIYVNVRKTVIQCGDETFYGYHITDISEYAMLIHEVSCYTNSVTNMSRFQSSIMKKLSMSYDTFLPGLADYCGSEEVVMFIKDKDKVIRSTYTDELVRVEVGNTDGYERFFSLARGKEAEGFFCILNTTIQGHECAVLIKQGNNRIAEDPMEASVHNVIRLFIENSILREQIVHESEHDKLTGLYNKGKYMALKKENFGSPSSIAVFNFDVNNLKHINDNYGHEYGDALIIKAAKSIAEVVSDNVFGFRMGGDEYVMVAVNVTLDEANEIRRKWKLALDKLNEEDMKLFCSIACGLGYGSGSYDYDELYAQADNLMYENKRELKAQKITSHIAE